MMSRLRPTLALLAALCTSCTYVHGDAAVMITSTPAGAEILVDGQLTDQTTPARIELDDFFGSNHEVTVRKPGYDAEKRTVYHYRTNNTSRWIDGVPDMGLPAFPLFWTFGDFFTPFEVRYRYVPHEIHVVLYEAGQGPVKAEHAAGK